MRSFLLFLLLLFAGPAFTQGPEKAWRHQYHQTLTMKMFMCDRNGKVHLTFEQGLEVIKKLDTLTRGIPKIIYLVGWQYNGHDTGYPSWGQVNRKLKRPGDDTALQSLRWLMDEAFKYHTTVSLHINMLDAQKDSPLWDEYISRDVIARNADGTLRKYKWGYPISYTREWEEGLAQRRIDSLCAMLPLNRAGTIHIDAFHTYVPTLEKGPISPYHKISAEREAETQRSIFRYWRDKGIDVTCEFDDNYRIDPFVGLQPMAWHFGGLDPMKIPASLYCGGRGGDPRFGQSMLGEGTIKADPIHLKGFVDEFCMKTLVWYYLNRLDRISDADGVVTFSGNVTSRKTGENLLIMKGEEILQNGGDVFVPALWKQSREIIAYSNGGYKDKSWRLPAGWQKVNAVQVLPLGLGVKEVSPKVVKVNGSTVALSLAAGEAVCIVPKND